ncbi:uncharacterized protein LOC142761482 [Rhinoderma darwinii]|uniref:uncharacterized protein LOC142761482 n=1 Tax=Rhinoderma darwinii TaxID=43563 RepID=UPI003F668A22
MPRQMDVGKLIRLVQERPEVWNTHAESYHDRTLKEAAWEQIAEALFEQEWADSRTRDRLQIVDDVKRRWRSSRDQFRREHGSGARSGDGGPQKRRYMYYDQLLFLREIMDMRPTSDTLDASEEEARPQCSQASEAAAPLVALTPEATREDPGPVASAPEAGQPDQVAPRQAAPRRRRPECDHVEWNGAVLQPAIAVQVLEDCNCGKISVNTPKSMFVEYDVVDVIYLFGTANLNIVIVL